MTKRKAKNVARGKDVALPSPFRRGDIAPRGLQRGLLPWKAVVNGRIEEDDGLHEGDLHAPPWKAVDIGRIGEDDGLSEGDLESIGTLLRLNAFGVLGKLTPSDFDRLCIVLVFRSRAQYDLLSSGGKPELALIW